MMLTALVLRLATLKVFLVSEQNRWTGSASPRLNGDVGWTGQPKQTAAPGKGPGRFGTGCFPGQCRDRQKLPPLCPPQDTQGSEPKRTYSIREGSQVVADVSRLYNVKPCEGREEKTKIESPDLDLQQLSVWSCRNVKRADNGMTKQERKQTASCIY